MNIIEAAEAAKAGKRIELSGEEAIWVGSWIEWKSNGSVVMVTDRTLSSNWRIIPDPPKLYPFSEAFERMKQGHWMKSLASGSVRCFAIMLDEWVIRVGTLGTFKPTEPFFTVYEIEGQWQEVTE